MVEVEIIYHTRVLSQRLLTLSGFIVPDLDTSILRARSYLSVRWVELALCYTSSMPHQFTFFWLSRDGISALRILIASSFPLFILSDDASTILFKVLNIYLMLFIGLIELFALPL